MFSSFDLVYVFTVYVYRYARGKILADNWREKSELSLFQKDYDEREVSTIVRLSPSLPTIAKALAEMLMHLQWRTVAIIRTGNFYRSNISNYPTLLRVCANGI